LSHHIRISRRGILNDRQHYPHHCFDPDLIGAVPAWPHSRSWGYGPSGMAGIVLVVLLILVLMGRI